MNLWRWLRRDLARADRPVERDELFFLVPAVVITITVAQWSEPGSTADLILLIFAGITLVARPLISAPPWEAFAAAVVTPVGVAVWHQGHLELSLFLVVTLNLYAAWHLGSTARAIAIAALSSIAIGLIAAARPDSFSAQAWIGAEVLTLILGRTLFHQRTLIAELEVAREALAEQAVARERQRIARELHDVTGHTLAAVLLHVTGARHVLRRDPDEAERALLQAEDVGRTSMDQIRATVTALRTSERGTDPPLPDAGELHALIDEYQRAGLKIDATVGDDVEAIDGPVGFALHRISREALANVARHARSNTVSVRICTESTPSRCVHLRISDHGRPPSPTESKDRYGIIGMTERARSLGGTLSAVPTTDGWSVDAVLPLDGSRP